MGTDWRSKGRHEARATALGVDGTRAGRLRELSVPVLGDLLRTRELVFVAGMILLGVVVFGPYVRSGGFANDDWVEQAWAHFGGFGGVFKPLIEATPRRPLGAVYFGLVHVAFGQHQHLQLALAAAERVAISICLLAVLRELRIDRVSATGAAVLALLFPFSDATWLWASAGQVSLAVVLWLSGLWVGLRVLRRGSVWHALAISLYVASILLYEIAVVAIALSGALYLIRAPRRVALRRWAADVAACGLTVLFVSSRVIRLWHGEDLHQVQSLSASLQHAGTIATQGVTLLARSLVPFGDPSRWLVVAAAVGLLAIGVMAARRTQNARLRHELTLEIGLVVAGVFVAVAGWATVTRAMPQGWYLPLVTGLSNRVNALAGVGFALSAVGLARLFGTLAFGRRASRWWAWPALLSVLAMAAIGAGYLNRVVADRQTWIGAQRERLAVLAAVRAAVGTPPTGTTIIATGFPRWGGPTVPVFATAVDLGSALQLTWNDPSIVAMPAAPASVVCTPGGVTVAYIGAAPVAAYGHTILVDVRTDRAKRIDGAGACRAAAMAAGVLA